MTSSRIAVALALLASACTPSRDNPADPTNRPKFTAYFVEADGSHVDVESHTHTVTFDATASCPGGGCTFDYDLDGDLSNGFELLAQPPLTTAKLPVVAADFTNGIATRIVSARAANGGIAGVPLVLTNSAPVADPGEDLFYPKNRGGDVVLDACGGGSRCTTVDADGPLDAIAYSWTLLDPDGSISPHEPVPADPDHRRIVFTAPSGDHEYVFRVTASDALGGVSQGYQRVFIGTEAWAIYRQPSRVSRVIQGRSFETMTTTQPAGCGGGNCFPGMIAHDDAAGTDWIEVRNQVAGHSSILQHTPGGNFATDTQWQITGECQSLVAGGVSVPVAAALNNDGTPHIVVFRPGSAVESVTAFTGEPRVLVRTRDPGVFWLVTNSAVYTMDVTLAAAVLTPVGPPGSEIDPIDAAPGVGDTLWVLDRKTGNDAVARLISRDGTFVDYRRLADAGVNNPARIAAGPEGQVWISDFAAFHVYLVGAQGAASVAPVDPISGSLLISFPADGSLWVQSAGESAFFHINATPSPYLEQIVRPTDFPVAGAPATYYWSAGEIDPKSGLLRTTAVFNNTTSLVVTLSPNADSAEIIIPLSAQYLTAEPARGSMWVSTSLGLERITPAARVLTSSLQNLAAGIGALSTGTDGGVTLIDATPDNTLFAVTRFDGAAAMLDTFTFVPVSIQTPANPIVIPGQVKVSDRHGAIECISTQNGENNGSGGAFTVFPGPFFRLDVIAKTATPLTPTPLGLSSGPVSIGADDSCWFATTGGTSRLSRVPAGASAANFSQTIVPGNIVSISVDPRNGAGWVRTDDAGANALLRFTTAGASTSITGIPAGPAGAVGLSDVCADTANPLCLDVWISAGTTLYRGNVDAANVFRIRQSYALPLAGAAALSIFPGNADPP